MPRIVSQLGSVLLVFGLAGCMYLPESGPSHRTIERYATASLATSHRHVVDNYVLVDITEGVLREVPVIGPGSFYRSFGDWRGKVPSFPVGVGDQLQITIYESTSGGLFTPSDGSMRPGNFVTLPTQTVSRSGTVSVPYAGDVPVAGRTVQEVQKEIVRRLAGRAVEPQVVVTVGEQVASSVTVIGETSSKLQMRGYERVLDVIARAGGAGGSGSNSGSVGFPSHEIFVTLVRKGHSATVYFPQLVRDQKENILVAPGDIIYVFRQQQRFVAFGNFGVSGQTGSSQGVSGFFPFDQERISLSDAVAKAGGLIDDRANAQVFVYRLELRQALERMGVDVSRFTGDVVPTVYRASFRDPSVFFYMQRFPMRNRDAIYVANADAVELEKFLGHTAFVSTAVAGTTVGAVVTRDAVRNLAHGAARSQ